MAHDVLVLTHPAVLRIWWDQSGSPDWSTELDVRVGGVYREVVLNRRLVFTWKLRGAAAERESLVTVELLAVPGGTELRIRQEPIFDPRSREGWRGSLERLGRLLQPT